MGRQRDIVQYALYRADRKLVRCEDSYLLVEGVITVIIISIPAVSKALARVKQMAEE